MPRPRGYRNSRDELTARQREVLLLLIDHLLAHQRPPTRREIGALLGCNASNAHCLLRALEQKGYLALDDAQPCGVRVVGACLTLLCPATPEGERLRRALGDTR